MIGCRPLSLEEWRAVEATFTGEYAARNRCLIVLGYTTGFRISELLALSLKDVAHGRSLGANVKVPRSAMKGKRQSRSVPLAPLARDALGDWLAELDACDLLVPTLPLFLSRKALRPITRQQAARILTSAFDAAEIWGPRGSLGTHSMRKTFAVEMHAQLHDVFKLQAALGHASPASTAAYLPTQYKEQVEATNAAFPAVEETMENVIEFNADRE